ncbi:MAG: rhombotarget lipoprotein [Nevskiaceae bacterium]
MRRLSIVLLLALMLGACASLWPKDRAAGVSASLVDFLYPKGEEIEAVTDQVPHLPVPLTVGLAFVPSRADCARCSAPNAALQSELLERVKARFADRNYIREIKVIPEAYMRAGRGFTALDQLSRLYGFDVIALVSYDQVALHNERKSSLLYWTLVGAYVVKGERNDVHTFVDTAVLDVKTRKLLMRAPGVDVRGFNSTSIDNARTVAGQQDAAMRAATEQMIANLDTELAGFRERIKSDNSVIVTRRPGSGGGGAGSLGALTLGLLALGAWRRARR